MPTLHIVQASLGDWDWLRRSARNGRNSGSWIVPKSVQAGDEIVVFCQGHGFVATAQAKRDATKREDWVNRYGASIGSVDLIDPPISLAVIRRCLPALTWAVYPRSITTPSDEVAQQVRALIHERRTKGIVDLGDESLSEMNLAELRELASTGVRGSRKVTATRQAYVRSEAIRRYALARSEGVCEHCNARAPFCTAEGQPYLEVHHITRLADEGPDEPENVIALCPNCHRQAHFSADAGEVGKKMARKVKAKEKSLAHGKAG